MSTLHLRTISLLSRWRPDYIISVQDIRVGTLAYWVKHRMGAEQPAAAAEACNQLQSAGSVQEAERRWEEHYIAGLLGSFLEEVVEDRCCIAGIAGEGVVRIYFRISNISLAPSSALTQTRMADQAGLTHTVAVGGHCSTAEGEVGRRTG